MLQQIRLKMAELQTLPNGSISGTYAALGTFDRPAQAFFLQNLTDVIITFSDDGTTDGLVLPSNGFLILDIGSNRGIRNTLSMAKGVTFYAKGSPTSGSVYLSYWYMG